MTFQEISDKLRSNGYTVSHTVQWNDFSFGEEVLSGIVAIKVTCSPFLLNDVMHELWLWLPSEYSVDKLDEQTIIINKKNNG
mgnify:FL=1